jgi:hypothetical protein
MLASHYADIRLLHISCVALSGTLFTCRGLLRLFDSPLANTGVLRWASYLIDTVLLGAAILLTLILHQYPLVNGWLNERGNKPMHAMEWDEGFPALAPHRLERTAGIANAIPGEPAPDPIGNSALRALEPAVLAFCSKAAHKVGAFVDLSDQAGNILGIILQIAVDQDQDFAMGRLEAGIDRRALTRVPFKTQHANRCVATYAIRGSVL